MFAIPAVISLMYDEDEKVDWIERWWIWCIKVLDLSKKICAKLKSNFRVLSNQIQTHFIYCRKLSLPFHIQDIWKEFSKNHFANYSICLQNVFNFPHLLIHQISISSARAQRQILVSLCLLFNFYVRMPK